METKENVFEAIILIVAVVATIFGVIKYNGKEIKNGNENNLPVYYVQTTATRGYDWVEVEYNGNVYSAWIDTESNIQTGDLIWAEFYIDNNEVKLVGVRKGERK